MRSRERGKKIRQESDRQNKLRKRTRRLLTAILRSEEVLVSLHVSVLVYIPMDRLREHYRKDRRAVLINTLGVRTCVCML